LLNKWSENMENKIILITGGAGFIGSNFIKYINRHYTNYKIINFDKLTYAGNLNNLVGLEDTPNYTFMKGDVAVAKEVKNVFEQYLPNFVVNFAAESHVDKSILDPNIFLETNIIGTQNMLNYAREHNVEKFIQISTDEVYGSVKIKNRCSENSHIMPNNPYAASKAAADHLVRVAYRMYNQNVNILRSCNNFGPFQFPEKFMPIVINNAIQNKKIPIYGDGLHIRNWVYVEDSCRAIDLVLHEAEAGEIFNIGTEIFHSNLDLAKIILSELEKSENLIEFVEDRKGHDRCYSTNYQKIRDTLNWRIETDFEIALKETLNWYKNHHDWLAEIQSGEYTKYNEQIEKRNLLET